MKYHIMEYRKNQEQIINNIIENFNNGKKLVILNAPTGSGKTIINLVAGKMIGGSYITSPLRVLVEQMKNDLSGKFKKDELGWSVMGRDAYLCPYKIEKEKENKTYKKEESYTADGAPCQNENYNFGKDNKGEDIKICPVKTKNECPYYQDKDKTMNSINSITTFDYFVKGIYDKKNGIKESYGWNTKPLLTIDEAHFLPTKLADFYSVNISQTLPYFDYAFFVKTIKNRMKNLTDQKEIIDMTIKEFLYEAEPCYIKNKDYLEKLKADQNSDLSAKIIYLDRKISIDKAIKMQQRIVNRLENYIYNLSLKNVEWVFNMDNNGIYWKPYSPAPFVENLWNTFNHIILSSATFFDIPEYLKDLGLDKVDYEIINVESTFDPEKGAIISIPGIFLNMKNFDTNISKVVNNIDKILEDHKNEKGIIHCHTYKYQYEILKRSKNKDRFIVHNSQNRQTILDDFLNSNDNKVLLSVNMGEGIDLIDDKSRFQILVKAPYPYRGDPWINLHYERSKRWYKQQTIIEIMQTCGRIIRSKDDWGITYLIDSNILSLLNQSDIPEWFMDRLKAGDKLRKKKLLDGIFDLNI